MYSVEGLMPAENLPGATRQVARTGTDWLVVRGSDGGYFDLPGYLAGRSVPPAGHLLRVTISSQLPDPQRRYGKWFTTLVESGAS